MNLLHRSIATFGLAALAIFPVAAQTTWPARTVTIVAPGGAGGTTDIFARLLAPVLAKDLGQSVVVENRPGGGLNIGFQWVAQAKPDGYTLLIGALALATNPHLYKTLSYDPQRDLQPVRLIARIQNVVAVNANSNVRSVADLIDLLRRNPGKYNYSAGTGTAVHLGTELFKSMTSTDFVFVPYKSSAEAVTAVLSGDVLVAFENMPVVLPHVKAGKLRALAVTSASRSQDLPDVPTLAESGLAGFDVSSWFGLLAPAGTPPEVVRRLDEATQAFLQTPEGQQKIRAMGAEPAREGPEAFRQLVRAEAEKWGPVIRKANIRVD